MKPNARRKGAFILLLLGLSTACGSDDTEDTPALGEGNSELDKSCPADTPAFDFGPGGLSAENEELGVKVFLEAASSRPPYYGMNDWTIAVTDMTGNPMSEASLNWACAFMPLHGHGSNPKLVKSLGDGRFELDKQNMAMQGGWEIRLWVDPTGGGEQYMGGGAPGNRSVCTGPTGEATLVLRACVPR